MKKLRCPRCHPIHLFILFFFFSVGFILAGATQTQAIGTCPPDITSYWLLNETSGTTFTDSVGVLDAVCTGVSCPGFSAGRIDNALVFDGVDDGVNVPSDASFNWGSAASFSIEFWMKTPSSNTCSGNQVIVGRDDPSTQLHWWVGCWNMTGVAAFRLDDKNGTDALVFGSTNLCDDKWHHITAVRDGILGENSIYVDGKLEGSQKITYTAGFDSATAVLSIGRLSPVGSFNFEGTVDEVAVYSRALTESEINQHFLDGSVGIGLGYCPDCALPARIMPLGDSITLGINASAPTNDLMVGYRQKLNLDLIDAGHNIDFVGSRQSGASAVESFDIDHEGRGGWEAKGGTEGGIAPNVNGFLVANPADVVLLHIGTNDISGGNQKVQDITEILNNIDLYSPDVAVVLARIINRADELAKIQATTQFNDDVAAMARTRIANGDKIIIVDQENALDYNADMDDIVHPNQAGYEKMADVWFNALDTILPFCTQVAPLIITPPVTTAYQGWPYVYNVDATGNPAPAFSLLATPPSGMTINPGTGIIQWTPDALGNYPVTVQADNGIGTDTQPFTISVATPPPCPSNIAHYWKLDEATAGSYADFYGANSATCVDCPSAVAGVVNGAQQFHATSRVNAKDDNTFDWQASDSFSIELWMKTDPASICSGTQVFVSRDDRSTSLQWWLGCNQNSGHARFFLRDKGGVGVAGVSSTTDLTDGSWHHVAATRDASAGTINIYVDGTRENSVSAPYASGFDSLTAPLSIGWLNPSPSFHFVGVIDEVAVYNRALSDTEVLQHYSAGSSDLGYCNPASPSIVSTPVTDAAVGVAYSYSVVAIGNPAPSFSLITSPSGMTINSATGVISWSPTLGQVGDNNVTVQAGNGSGIDSQSFVITVASLPVYALQVATSGTGTGTIVSINGGISCGLDCTENYASSTVVTLTAMPDAGSTFGGWTGACAGTGTCIVTMDATKSVTGTFTPAVPLYNLTVATSGTGTGKVTSSPLGIDCGADCVEGFAIGTKATKVRLTAIPDPGSTFKGWSGAYVGKKPKCKLVMDASKAVIAEFALPDLTGTFSNTVVSFKSTSYRISTALTVSPGEANAANVTIKVYLSDDDTLDGADTLLTPTPILLKSLKMGKVKPKKLKLVSQTDPAGKYLIAVLDPDNTVLETVDSNNSVAGLIP